VRASATLSRAFALCLPAVAPLGFAGVSAQDYPTRPIKWVISFPAGGPNDVVARVIGQFLSERLGQPVIIENKPGAGGSLGMASVLASPPDGYTIAFVAPNYAINATLYAKLPYDFVKDSVPVAGTMRLTNVMVVHPSVPVKTVAEFVAHAKANPGKVNFASGGVGTTIHMAGELFKSMTGIDIVHVPYRGSAPALTDMLSGQVQVMFDNLPTSIEHIRSGRLRALAVTVGKRWPALPDLPTVGETVPGYETSLWYGIVAPKGTPPEIVNKLNAAITAVLADPKLVARLADLGGVPMPMTPAELGKLVADDVDKWAKVIKATGVKIVE
jgi:tripartite-type tricarboxylate transporter receptor subunit TctC